jgi:hypothetical protein
MLMEILNDWRRALLLKRERILSLSDIFSSFISGFNEQRHLDVSAHFYKKSKKKGGEKG